MDIYNNTYDTESPVQSVKLYQIMLILHISAQIFKLDRIFLQILMKYPRVI